MIELTMRKVLSKLEQEAARNLEAFSKNEMVGRGFILGLSPSRKFATQTYWMVGRSPGSRNRIFVREDTTTIKTDYHDESVADHSQDHLIIYKAMAEHNGKHLVSNGRQINAAIAG